MQETLLATRQFVSTHQEDQDKNRGEDQEGKDGGHHSSRALLGLTEQVLQQKQLLL